MKILLLIAILFAILLIAILIIFPYGSGETPAVQSVNGLSERAMVTTDDGELTVMLISENIKNPVLIVCGGGPGIPQYLLEDMYPSRLAESFTVCYWDYRGTGLNYREDIVSADMTTERYISDTGFVTDYLAERFRQNKIYIMGHSFGSYVALKTVQAHPEKYVAYFAMSQITDEKQSEYLAFDYMKDCYEKQGDAKMVKAFSQYDIRGKKEDFEQYFFSGLRDQAMHDLGVGTTKDMHDVISGIFLPSLRCKAYTWAERINIWKGKAASKVFPVTKDAIERFNAFNDVPKVEIPVLFLVGKHDYTCCASLQELYYRTLQAPAKTIYTFEDAAHSPIYEDPVLGKTVIANFMKEIS